MKDGPYLTHDIGARNDPKIVAVEMEMKGQGKAIWWDLVEMLWESGGYLPMDFKRLAYTLRYPSEDEVRSVVMDFGLFENDGERFWNDSALERIQHKKDISARNAENRRGKVSQNDRSTTDEGPFDDRSTTDEGPFDINKSIKKEIKKSLSPGAQARAGEDEEMRERIFEIFFFKNFADPVGEVERFWSFYAENGWKNSNGRKITNIERTAEEWRPEKPGARFPAHFLEWYKTVYAAAKSEGDGIDGMLTELLDVSCTGKREYTLIFTNNATRDAVADFIEANGLQRGTKLKYGTKK